MNIKTRKIFKKKLIDLELNQEMIAKRLDVTAATISLLLSGHRNSNNLKIAIARIVGMTYRALWVD